MGKGSNKDNLFSLLVDSLWDAGVVAFKGGSNIVCKAIGYETEEQKEEKKKAVEYLMRKRKEEEDRLKEENVERKNKITILGKKLDFNELFFNCGLKNKLKDMPTLEGIKNYSSVDIYSFKLPVGVTVSSVYDKIEHISDFFEVNQMNVKLQKKNGLMDIIITKDNLFNRVFDYEDMKLSKRLQIPLGHFINQDYIEKMLVIDMSRDEIAHGFIGSTTGGGKSNFIRCMLLNWIMNKPVEDLELFLIDGKGGTDYASFIKAPHVYMNKCFNNSSEIVSILEGSLAEILRRNQIFIEAGCNNFNEYTEVEKHKMPRRVIIFDEYAMYHGTSDYSTMQSRVGKICSTGRSAGIHILVATQDGRKEVLDSMIKYNMPLKIGFKCDNAQHSKNVSGYEGLETINRIGVGRAFGLPIDTDYIQFKTMKAPSSAKIREMISNKFSGYDRKHEDRIRLVGTELPNAMYSEYVPFGEECEGE